MNDIPVGFHPEAVDVAEAAVVWYAKRSIRAAKRFIQELEMAISGIEQAPDRWPGIDGIRRVPLLRFPYFVIYRFLPDRIEILAVAHARRRPGYWRGRTD